MPTEHPPPPARCLYPLSGSALPAPALLPRSPGAEQRCRGDEGLRLGAAIPRSCGLAENYCSAGEENNILFTVSPGTRLRAEQVLTHRLRRGAEMQSPAASCELSSALPEPHSRIRICTGTRTHHGCPRGPEMGFSASRHLRQFVTVPPQATGAGLAQPTPSKTVG